MENNMWIKDIKLNNFRNYNNKEISPPERDSESKRKENLYQKHRLFIIPNPIVIQFLTWCKDTHILLIKK